MSILTDQTDRFFGLKDLYFNNTYDKKYILDNLNKSRLSSYMNILENQVNACGFEFIYGNMKDFRIDRNFNYKYSLPWDAYSATLTDEFINHFSEVFTLSKTKYKEKVLYNTLDIASNSTIFKKKLIFLIDGKLFIKINFIFSQENVYLVIYSDNINGISKTTLKDYIEQDLEWSIILSPHSILHYREDFGKDMIDEVGAIASRFTEVRFESMIRSVDTNSYFMGITDNVLEPNILTLTRTKKVKSSNGYSYEILSDEYREKAKSLQKGIFVVINDKYLSLINDLGNIRRFSIDLDLYKPIPPQNILVFNKDINTGVLKYNPHIKINLYYPNVYSIDNANEDDLLYIHIYSENDNLKFINPIKNYMNYLGKTEFMNKSIEGSIPIINTYSPIRSDISISNYIETAFKESQSPDFYTLNKYRYFLNDNRDNLGKELSELKMFYTRYIKESIYDMKSPLSLLYRDTINSNINIINTPSMDNKVPLLSNEEDKLYTIDNKLLVLWEGEYPPNYKKFDERMIPAQIKYNEGLYKVVIFIDGLYYPDFEFDILEDYMYIYIPERLINEFSIVRVIEFYKDKSIELDAKMRFLFTNQNINFPMTLNHFADTNLMYYFEEDGLIIPNSHFTFDSFVDLNDLYILSDVDENYLYTNEDELLILNYIKNKGSSIGDFHKDIFNRLNKIDIGITDNIRNMSVMSNRNEITNPIYIKDFDKEKVFIELDSYDSDNKYYTNLLIDNVIIPTYDIYTEKNELGIPKMYIYFDKTYILETSNLITFKLLFIDENDFDFIQDNPGLLTPSVSISTPYTNYIDKEIIVKNISTYESKTFKPSNTTDLSFIWNEFKYKTEKSRFRIYSKSDLVDGYSLIDFNDYDIAFANTFNQDITITFNEVDTNLIYYIEYLPYNQKYYYIENINTFDDIILINTLPRPIDDNLYDIFIFNNELKGIRLKPDDYTMLSQIMMKLNITFTSTTTLLFIEQDHDIDSFITKGIFSLEDRLIAYDVDFKNYMLNL